MNDSGEREVVLGNKQLLTIFFVAALLCGVFFAVGYVVGGNSAKTAAASVDGAPAQAAEGKREEPQPTPATDTTASAAAPVSGDTAGNLPAAEPKVTDNPAAAGAQPLTPAPVVSAPAQAPATVPPPKPVSAAASTPEVTGVFLSVPEKGTTYWQVTAVRRPEADGVVKALREAKFPAILAESSNPNLFRVLVGPYRSTGTMVEAKRKLTELSYNGLIRQSY